MIEIIVVLAVLSLIAGVVLARGPQRSAALEMRQATERVASALRLARTDAIASNRPVAVAFDVRAMLVRAGQRVALTVPGGIVLSVVVADGQGPTIIFLPDGSATGGQVRLVGQGRVQTVSVDWLTGRVTVGPVEAADAG